MRLFLVACVAALSLGGCEKSSTTSITRTQANGVATLYSKGTVVEGQARFQCIASRSGQCHYVVLDPACSTDAACAKPPLRRASASASARTR
ncbi:hypothetical protein G6F50_018466 [Rhizopus delemar]|uniref:Lipoprotein n=1 Tax=Rhizopus delemar TaxID=936053 RepID=A0A9P7BYR2_9FUNG|nr:hypothetical protein G6F50_018466 [Rhizopus delemar]